ncbi:MAG: glycosyltransferase family 2 protein, partial [Muribaculaceae bacterium]|nr:glycosyltransferase family 2 protein [Muribaculaceae bacterium]
MEPDRKPLLTILVPCHNEEANLMNLYNVLDGFSRSSYVVNNEEEKVMIDINELDLEFLFVDDGSKDATNIVLKSLQERDSRINVVSLSRNFGKENAMLAGMDFAQGDAVVIMDADLQDPIEVVPEMIYWWREGYDDVYGKRIGRGKESWLRRKLSLSFYSLLKKMSDIDILPNVGDFRLLDRKAVNSLRKLRETQRYTKG